MKCFINQFPFDHFILYFYLKQIHQKNDILISYNIELYMINLDSN